MTLGMWGEVCNRWVGPALRVTAVGRCHIQLRMTPGGDRAESAVPDSLAVAVELACGATATYHLALRAAFAPGHAIEIYGSRGALVYKLFAEEIHGATEGDEALHTIAIPPGEERAHSTDAEFIEAIRGGGPVSPSFEDGVRYMEFCEAVALSLRTGAAVAVPPAAPAMESWGRPISP
jgi:predicted dehydrogenase